MADRMQRHEDFLKTRNVYVGKVPKKDRVWLARCVAMAQDGETQLRASTPGGQGGKRPASYIDRTPERFLLRRRMRQGPPYKCPLIREMLWDWFVDIRASLATTISPKFVLLRARQIADSILKHQRATGEFSPMPELDRKWLARWKRDKGVVFRRPNMRFKCSKPVLLARLRAMWRNCIAVRRLAHHYLKGDLGDRMYGIDEKPVHFNESGSKNVRTLEIVGAPAVRLKQNHAATRERVSLMTCVSSDQRAAVQPRRLPLELLFKARSPKRIRSLRVPPDLNISLQWADKGSYRQEHLLLFLRRWLDPWSDERAAAQDYRILLLDVAKSHIGDAVVDFAWERGYVALYHYGCTTGVAQVNDTDLHGDFERLYVEREQASFNEQQLYLPGCVSRRPQDVLDDAAATWRALDHERAASGHKRTGLSNALDGTEDHLISREALDCWRELDMGEIRRATVAEVDQHVASGLLTSFADWRMVVKHPVDPGVVEEEGAEFEGDLEEGELPWEGEQDAGLHELDDKDVMNMAHGKDAASGLQIVAEDGDDAKEVDDAVVAAERLNKLRRLRADAVAAKVPSAAFKVDQEVAQLERGLRAKTREERQVNKVLRRAIEQTAQKEAANLKAQQAEARKAMQDARVARAKKAAAKKSQETAKLAKQTLAKKLDDLPKTFSVASCQDPKAGWKNRRDCLERLKLRSPALAFAAEAQWTVCRDAYAKRYPKVVKSKIGFGAIFIKEINAVLEKLGCHYAGPSKFNAKGEKKGDQEAFAKFFKNMQKHIPKPADAAIM